MARSRRRIGLVALLLVGLLLAGCGARGPEPSAARPVQPGQSIQAAIDQARPGETIILARGTWEENLRIEKSITLRGAGPEATILKAAQPGPPVVWVRGDVEVRLEGLALQEGRGGYVSPTLSSAGLFAQDGARVVLERVHIQNHAASGIYARDQAQVTLRDSLVADNARYGLELGGNVKTELHSSRIVQNKAGGGWLAEEAVFTADLCEISRNNGPGIWARDSSVVRLFASRLEANAKNAVLAQDQAKCVLLGVHLAQHNESGVYVTHQAELSAYGSSLEGNWNGLEADGGRIYLERCAVRNSRWDGIRAQAGILELYASELAGGRGAGLNVSGSCRLDIRSSHITGFALAGISGFSRYPVQGEDNVITHNGVALLGHVNPRVRRPLAQAQHPHLRVEGVDADLQALVDAVVPGGTLELGPGRYPAGLTVDKPLELRGEGAILVGAPEAPVIAVVQGGELRLAGVHLTGGSEGLALGGGSRAELQDCALWENGAGIKLWQDAQLVGTRLSVSHHPQGGLWLWDQAQAELTEATFYANGLCGISVAGRSRLILRRSTLMDNGWQGGLMLRERAEVELYENFFVNNRGYGLAVQDRACLGSGPGFYGNVRGRGNVFEGNYKGPSCPEALSLMLR